MEKFPALDITIPVRNGGEPLAATLRALKASRDQDFRILISDNYSTDGNPWKSSLQDFAPERVVLMQPPEPLGRVEHWTWLARHAKADFCKLLICGDILPPDYLETIAPAFAEAPDLIFTPYLNIGAGVYMEDELRRLALQQRRVTFSASDYRTASKTVENVIGPLSCVTFRTASLQAALPFEPAHAWTADWRLYSRVMNNGRAIRCEGTYCLQDRRIARLSSSFKGSLNGIFESRAYLRELNGMPPASSAGRWLENLPSILGLVLRTTLPTFLYRLITLQGIRRRNQV